MGLSTKDLQPSAHHFGVKKRHVISTEFLAGNGYRVAKIQKLRSWYGSPLATIPAFTDRGCLTGNPLISSDKDGFWRQPFFWKLEGL
jgi:hypothetical protein